MDKLLLIPHITNIQRFNSQDSYLNQKDVFNNYGARYTNRITKLWYYYKENDFICLKYEEFIYDNKKTNDFYIKYIDKKHGFSSVKFIIEDEIKYIENSNFSFNKTEELKLFIENEIGASTFSSVYDIGWCIKDFLKITINKYNYTITCNYKNKDVILTEKKLRLFIDKNKTSIIKAMEIIKKKYKLKLEKSKELEDLQKLESLNLNIKINKLTKENLKELCKVFSIKKTFKERYEIQSCKPFPEKYEWNKQE